MENERHVTVLAVERLAAFPANADLGIAATVHEHNRLVAFRNALHQGIAQVGRHEDTLLLAYLPHIDNAYLGQACGSRALLQPEVF